MKNNYNPYLVPEDFFEKSSSEAISRYRNKRRAIRIGAAAAVVVAVLLIAPAVSRHSDNSVQEVTEMPNELANLYQYDIFLQVNFQ